MTNEFERATAFDEALRHAVAERLVESSVGTAFFADSLPRVWALNTLRVERRSASFEEIVAEANRLQGGAGLDHRRVLIMDESAGRKLEEAFVAQEWRTDAFVFMVWRRDSTRALDTTSVEEVDSDVIAPLRETILREWLTDVDDALVQQIHEANLRVGRAGNARHFAVVVDGVAVSATELYSDGTTAQIEDVATDPDHRGQGHASAVVLRALEEARATGHEFVFLVADSRDWPKELYRRLGFDPVGEQFAYRLTESSAEPRRSTGAE
jgi:ribosomal protein S18 acetylase RimI-like enzyme